MTIIITQEPKVDIFKLLVWSEIQTFTSDINFTAIEDVDPANIHIRHLAVVLKQITELINTFSKLVIVSVIILRQNFINKLLLYPIMNVP